MVDRRLPLGFSIRTIGCLALTLLAACGSQDCGCDGFEARPFPPQHYDKTVQKSTQIRVSESGLGFVEDNIEPLVSEALPDGLSFCLPKDTDSDTKLCFPYVRDRDGYHMRGEQPICDDGVTEGCQINLTIEETQISTVPPQGLQVEVTIGNLNPTIPIEADIPLLGSTDCDVTPYLRGANINTPATIKAIVPIEFLVDEQSPTRDIRIDIEEVGLNLENLDFDLKGGFTCGTADLLRGLIRGTIEDLVRDQLDEVVNDLLRENLCLSCEMDPCPGNSTCSDDNICDYNNTNECVPLPLGIEGALDLSATIGDFTETKDAEVNTFAKLADYASADTGLTLTLRTGFQPERLSDCVPIDPTSRPRFNPVPISPTLIQDVRPGTNDPFHLGIGIHKGTIEHLLWSAWASGATCLTVESLSTPQVSTAALGLFLPSLNGLTDNENAQAELKIVPQTAPVIQLGTNQVMETADGYEVVDGLFTLDWKDLDLHIYGWVQDRWTRVVTVRLDLLLPIAVVPDGAGSVSVVLGDVEAALQNLRGVNGELLTERPEVLANVIPSLVGIALPTLADTLDLAFELPEFFGLRVDLQQGDITSVDGGQFIALFADLAPAMQPNSFPVLPVPHIDEVEVVYPEEPAANVFMRPELHVNLAAMLGLGLDQRELVAGDEVEYAWRIDGGFWSLYHKRDDLVIRDPVLALPGSHELEVRARVAGSHLLVNREQIASRQIIIDYQPPTLDVERAGDELRFVAQDIVDPRSALQFRYRIHDGERARPWTAWSNTSTLQIAELGLTDAFRVEVEVRDQSGLIERDTQTIHQAVPSSSLPASQDAPEDPSASSESSSSAACAQAPGSQAPGSAPWMLGLGLIGMVGLLRRRRAKLVTGAFALLGLGATSTGCGGCGGDATSSNKTSLDCAEPCAEDEVCKQAQCVAKEPEPCTSNESCSNGQQCEQGVCVEPECREDADCGSVCGVDEKGTCTDNACVCEMYCADGCADTEFCCHTSNSCETVPDPCDGTVCDPGFEPGNPVAGTPDSSTCTISGAMCECVPSPPLPLGLYGRWADLTQSSSGDVAISAYNQTYGDLMVGVRGADGSVSWDFVDGVPESGTIEGALDGPRGGIKDRGPKVGGYTAAAFDDAGNLHVFYQDLNEDALKYARGVRDQDAFTWSTTTIAQGESVGGLYNEVLFANGALHLVTLVDNISAGGNGPNISELRYLAIDPASPLDSISFDAAEVVTSGPASEPCSEECEGDDVCIRDLGSCVTPASTCEVECAAGFACHMGTCLASYDDTLAKGVPTTTGNYPELTLSQSGELLVTFHDGAQDRMGWRVRDTAGEWSMTQYLEQGTGPYGSAVQGADGTLHFAYMHEASRTLRYEAVSSQGMGGNPEIIIGGLRDTGVEWLVARIGEDVQIQLDASNSPEVIFQDATLHRLMYARRDTSGAWTPTTLSQKLDPYEGSHGFYPDLLRAGEMSVVVEYVIDRQADPNVAMPVFHELP